MVCSLFLLPALLALYGLAPGLAFSAAALLLVGASYIGVLSGLNTVVQLRAPEASRGRILSFYMLALGTLYPIGAVIEGGLGRLVGVREVTVGSAVLLVVTLAAVAALRPGLYRALGGPGDRPRGGAGVTGDPTPLRQSPAPSKG